MTAELKQAVAHLDHYQSITPATELEKIKTWIELRRKQNESLRWGLKSRCNTVLVLRNCLLIGEAREVMAKLG